MQVCTVQDPTPAYTENRLVKAIISGDSVRFDYDPLGQPVVRRGLSGEGMRVTLYDGGSILADLDSAGNRVGEYVYDQGTDRPYALLKGATTVTGAQYFVQDDFGNVTGTLLDSVTVGQRVTYDGNGLPAVTGDRDEPSHVEGSAVRQGSVADAAGSAVVRSVRDAIHQRGSTGLGGRDQSVRVRE